MRERKRIACFCFALLSPCLLPAQQLGKDWGQATAHAQWADGGVVAVHDGKMWVFAWPAPPAAPRNEVWYSSDGVRWSSATLSAPYHGGACLAFNGRIWTLGGTDNNRCFNDVWYSSDGANWTSATLSASWAPRAGHKAVAFQGKMWILGGVNNDVYPYPKYNDVWYSSDGIHWTSATLSAAWAPRCVHASVVHDGRIWVIGGIVSNHPFNNDVWHSSDGVHWTSATLSAAWPPRAGQSAVVYSNKIWVMGGLIGNVPRCSAINDVWYSPGFYSASVRSWRLYP